jgi:polycomb protein EED
LQSEVLDEEDLSLEFYNAKFYPYSPPGAPPILAIVSKKHVIVCRIVEAKDSPVEIIRILRSEKFEGYGEGDIAAATNIACCWAKDADTGRPLLCVAGNDSNITVHDVKEGTIVKVSPLKVALSRFVLETDSSLRL